MCWASGTSGRLQHHPAGHLIKWQVVKVLISFSKQLVKPMKRLHSGCFTVLVISLHSQLKHSFCCETALAHKVICWWWRASGSWSCGQGLLAGELSSSG